MLAIVRQMRKIGCLGSYEIRCVGAARNQDSQRGRQAFEGERGAEDREREVLKTDKLNIQFVKDLEPLSGSP